MRQLAEYIISGGWCIAILEFFVIVYQSFKNTKLKKQLKKAEKHIAEYIAVADDLFSGKR